LTVSALLVSLCDLCGLPSNKTMKVRGEVEGEARKWGKKIGPGLGIES
jgi:hypothetical protein